MMKDKMTDWNTFVEQCGELLTSGAGGSIAATREAAMPLLSVFLGTEADRHADVVREVYRKCWRNAALLHDLTTEQYMPADDGELAVDNAEDEIFEMLSQKVEIVDKSQAMIAYYWDIADDRYDAFKKELEEPFHLPQNTEPLRVIFAICRETTRETRRMMRRRKPDLIEWTKQHGIALVLLSDNTYSGILDEECIWQAYQIAADIMLVACSYYEPGSWRYTPADPGEDLRFRLKYGGLYGTAYIREARNTEAIARITLATALKHYKEMIDTNVADSRTSIEDKISGGKGYQSLFRTFFTEHMTKLFPAEDELEFLQYLPCVPQAAASASPAGLFGALKKKVTAGGVPNAAGYEEVSREVWNALYNCDYLQPAARWMASEEGKKEIADWASHSISRNISFADIRSRLEAEAADLKKRAETPDEWKRETTINETTQEEVMHREFMGNCFCQCCQTLAARLAEEMKRITDNISGFEVTVDSAISALPLTTIDPVLRNAYERLTSNVLVENPEILRDGIHPGDDASLQKDLGEAFRQIIQKKPEYRCNLKLMLKFLNGVSEEEKDPLTALFEKDLKECIYLQMIATPTNGCMYCLMDPTAVRDAPADVGEIFSIGQSDSIERLMIYPVNVEQLL